jgi:hypothetical protein
MRASFSGRHLAIVGMLSLCIAVLLGSDTVAEVTQKDGVRVVVDGELMPKRLPRRGRAPVAVTMSGHIAHSAASNPPQLRALTVEINREGRIATRGIPTCRMGRIDPSSTSEALTACRESLVGEGTFSANVLLPEQSPFPSRGKILAFNGRLRGRPAIFAHIYGSEPVPTSYVLPFAVHSTKGTYGTKLEAKLPSVTGEWGFVTGLSLELAPRLEVHGRMRPFVTAGCPAPAGVGVAPFPLMRTIFSFDGGLNLTNTLVRTCRAVG